MAILAVAVTFLCVARRADAASPVPLVIDTDIYSNADDVSAISSAFALEQQGEAQVLAITVNNPTVERSAVATDSWKCVAAIDNFYGHPDVPLGAEMPDDGPASTSPYVQQCAQLAPPSTPAPADAVNVLRQALVDSSGGVVLVEIGYEGNLEALLKSQPDAISPLTGAALVAAKVSRLVVTGGTYPSSPPVSSNFGGDPTAAQYVAANWPTEIVWAGDDVGNAVRTGYSVPCVHPANSPLLVSLDAFVGPPYTTCSSGPNIPSYDPATLYHAVMGTSDTTLTENGPGTNVVDQYGDNTFTTTTPPTGNQYYLSLASSSSAATLAGEIESLLDTLPPTGSIGGTVDAAATGRPLAGVSVQAKDALGNAIGTTTTAANGTYSFAGVYGGSYTLTFTPVSGSGYGPFTDSGVSLTAGQSLTGVNVALTAPLPANTALPTISGSAQVGQTLTEGHGSWTNNPTSYAYQWEDCAHGTCSAIAGATAQRYTITAADVGSTIRVEEFATNVGGTSAPASSNATAVVPQPPTTTGTTTTPTTPTTTTPTQHVTVSSRQIRALLRRALAMHGRRARIRALRHSGGYRFTFAAPLAGRLAIDWYRMEAHGRKLLVARARVVFHSARSATIRLVLTRRGRALLAHRGAVRLLASGSFAPVGGATVRATRRLTLRS